MTTRPNRGVFVLIDGIWIKQPNTEKRLQMIESMIWGGNLSLKDVKIDPTDEEYLDMVTMGVGNTK